MMPKPAIAPAPPPPAPQDVEGLVTRAAGGDVPAFERLVAQYQPKVFAFALTFTPDRDEAADLAQEAMVKVYRSISGFRFQSSFTTWLFQIVKNCFLDTAKSRAAKERAMQRPLQELASGETDQLAEAALAEDRLIRDEDRQALHRALGRVPESFRMVVVLFDMQGMSYDEIAQSLQVPVGTVKSRLKRGRDALREAIFRQQGATRQTGNEGGHEHDRL